MGRQIAEVESELQETRERAERAERALEALRDRQASHASGQMELRTDVQSEDGADTLRRDDMMAHLMNALEAGKDIGHYGRLVFAMVARHYLSEEELLAWLRKDRGFEEPAAHALLRQVEGRDYNPPRRERILEWQSQQDFPILPNADDPDCGNVYRTLKFPDSVYEHIQEYQEEKAEAAAVDHSGN